jgi:hypothetical protein
MKFYNVAIFATSALLVAALPKYALAANIICSLHVRSDEAPAPEKWNADHFSLYAIGAFYRGVGELQRISIFKDAPAEIPRSILRSGSALDAALEEFALSLEYVNNSLAIADEFDLGDEAGLRNLRDLRSGLEQILASLEDGHHPRMELMHAVARATMRTVTHGIELSIRHLETGMPGHGAGGANFPLE